ncbi:MAG: ABC transporter permease [Ktedonobacterales bacterium]|nr:ABC transporter permease [Ktedonobacterales bacterium]
MKPTRSTPLASRLAALSWGHLGRDAAKILAPLGALAVLLAFWQIYVVAARVNTLILPPPSQIVRVTVADWAHVQQALLATLGETAIGFAVALTFGLLCAALLDLLAPVRQALYPLLVASQSIPIVAIAPLLQLWFGTDLTAKVIVITLVCFFPITVAGLDGLRATEPDLLRLYRGFGASAARILWEVRLPGALPALFSGIRIAITYSVVGAIFSEYIGAEQGLGVYLRQKQAAFRVDLVIGVVAVTALASIALFLLVMLIERLAIPWFYAERRRGTTT